MCTHHKPAPKPKRASEIFKFCPCCQTPITLAFDDDVLCTHCSWTSIEASVASGAMDRLFGIKPQKRSLQ